MAAMHPAMAQQTPSTPNPNSVDRCWKSSVIPIPFMVGDLIAIEIVDLTINSMVMFHVAVYQRVIWLVVSTYPSEK
jgi:hypothetical protein